MSIVQGPPRSRLSAAARRATLLDAAESLIAARGYGPTRLEDIATEAGVTKQLLSRHFATKQEIHLELLAKHRDGLLAVVAQTNREAPLPDAIDAWFSYLAANPYAAKLLLQDTTGVPEVAAFHQTMRQAARQSTIEAIQRDPRLDVPEELLEPLAETIRSAIVGLGLWWSDAPHIPRSAVTSLTTALLASVLTVDFRSVRPDEDVESPSLGW